LKHADVLSDKYKINMTSLFCGHFVHVMQKNNKVNVHGSV